MMSPTTPSHGLAIGLGQAPDPNSLGKNNLARDLEVSALSLEKDMSLALDLRSRSATPNTKAEDGGVSNRQDRPLQIDVKIDLEADARRRQVFDCNIEIGL